MVLTHKGPLTDQLPQFCIYFLKNTFCDMRWKIKDMAYMSFCNQYTQFVCYWETNEVGWFKFMSGFNLCRRIG